MNHKRIFEMVIYHLIGVKGGDSSGNSMS